ncbi:DCN1-like protein 5 [Vanacampus margaritifer]
MAVTCKAWCESPMVLRSKLDSLRAELDDVSVFKSVYKYSFDFTRDDEQSNLDMDTAKKHASFASGRNVEQCKYNKGVNKDQWYKVF